MGKTIDLSLKKLTGKNISIGTLVTGFLAYGAMLTWMNANFITEVQGAQITTSVEDNRQLIVDLTDEFRITTVMNTIRQLKYADFQLEIQENDNGPSSLLNDRRRDVKTDLEQAIEYKDCLLKPEQIRPKCKFLAR